MKLVAHRGGRGFGTENTLEAMIEAVKAGVRCMETDVRTTGDGQLVICHDGSIWGRAVKRTSYEELLELVPDRPLLRDVLEHLAGWVSLNLEVKEAPCADVGGMIREYNIEGDTLVSSFNPSFLRRFKENFPEVQTGYLYRMSYRRDKKLVGSVSMGAEVILPHFHSIDPDLLRDAHELGLEVYAWTVNADEDLWTLRNWGVDGIITDRYTDFRALLEEASGEEAAREAQSS